MVCRRGRCGRFSATYEGPCADSPVPHCDHTPSTRGVTGLPTASCATASDPLIGGVRGGRFPDVTVGILVTVIGGVILAATLALSKSIRDRVKAKGEEATETIRIEPPAGLQESTTVRYALLYVRDGTDEVAGQAEPRNEVVDFHRAGPTALEARLVYRRKLGCQFKCFFDIREGAMSRELIAMLTADGPWTLDEPKLVLREGDTWSRYH